MPFTRKQQIKFRHCDPAGIVFYPRYFEMINDTVEVWFDESLGHSFADIHPQNGVPTGQIQTRFTAPSRLGDELTITLEVQKVGTASLTLNLTAKSADEPRFSAQATLIYVDSQGKSEPWPDALRKRIHREMETTQ